MVNKNAVFTTDFTTVHDIKCTMFNARSLKNKLPELHYILHNDKPDVVIVTETWLDGTVTDSVLCGNSGYSIFRNDRESIGGGVLILTKNGAVTALPVPLPDAFSALEIVATDICSDCQTFRIINCYRKPTYDDDAYQYLVKLIECLCVLSHDNVTPIIVGDFNLPNVTWDNEVYEQLDNCPTTSLFLDYVRDNAMYQFVPGPTRINHSTGKASILDLVLCPDNCALHDVAIKAPFSTSDHNLVCFKLLYKIEDVSYEHTYYDFANASWVCINDVLANVNWEAAVFKDAPPEVCFDAFYSVLNHCIANYVPVKVVRPNAQHRKKYPLHIRRLLRKKQYYWRSSKHFNSAALHDKYVEMAKKCKHAIEEYNRDVESRLIDSNNIGRFYKHCNSKFRSRTNVPFLKQTDGTLTTDPKTKAEMLNLHFASVYTKDNDTHASLPLVNNGNNLCNVNFSAAKILTILKRLKNKSAAGPDGIPAIFYKECAFNLMHPLARLFQIGFENSYLPGIWKFAFVSPVHKKVM